MRSIIKLSDIIGGTIAMLVALPYITQQPMWLGERVTMIAAALVGLGAGWYVAQDRHWIVKIFLYTGIMLLATLVANLLLNGLFID
jgi:hypothetical protein